MKMAGTEEPDMESEELLSTDNECSFLWDETSQLYFHAKSGFYHDPKAGWYYSSADGFYYKFEDGNYVLLETENASILGSEVETDKCIGTLPSESTLDESAGDTKLCSDHGSENLRPTSEWLEDTLIEIYLSGSNPSAAPAAADDDDVEVLVEPHDADSLNVLASGTGELYELEEGEWIPDDLGTDQIEPFLDEGDTLEEEKWKAQYGQVIQSVEDPLPNISAVDLWDWTMITGRGKDGKRPVVRLVGRLVKGSSKLHPSMPSGGGLFKTASICEAHLDLVRVTSGRVYKLRTPSAKQLASLSIYDSSNPTKDWGFPELSDELQAVPHPRSSTGYDSKMGDEVCVHEALSMLPDLPPTSGKHGKGAYRDRAAERRNLHGGFGIGPGQKNTKVDDADSPSSPVSASTEVAAAEALNLSFGSGSYARRLLQNMGWKEGETLGKTMKGLKEPLKAIGNKGNAGLGWSRGTTEYS